MKQINKSISILIAIGMMIINLSCGNAISKTTKEDKKPNIILIYMDDMGYGDLECYGHPLIKTPNLNKLAADGIKFTSFYAPAAVCTPSRAGLLTGKYPVRTTPFNFGPESTKGLPLSEITLADVLKTTGYKTGIIGKWHLGHKPEYLPTSRGFDSFYGLPYSNDMILPWCPWLSENDKLMLYEDATETTEIGTKQDDLTLDYTNKAVSFIKENNDKPFFLYLAHSMPHLPVSVSKNFKGISSAGLYGDVVEMVDWSVGEILKTVKEARIEQHTLIIFTSDNGPWHNLPDRMVQGGVERWHTGSSGPFRGAKATTYEGGFRVPAIMYWQGQIPPNQINRDIVSALDIFPTVVDISGAEVPEDHQLDGINILPLLQGKSDAPRSTFIYCKEKTVQAIRKNEWKLRYTEPDGIELYNLHKDPSEMYNRADEFPDMAKALLGEMREFARETRADIYGEGN